ncbi:MAG: DUF4162 domain-containing protein, partial [Flavobacteriaceae bacterium]
VVLESADQQELLNELEKSFHISSPFYNISEKILEFTVSLPQANTRDFLAFLSTRANVISFVETVPSANDIFIQAVQKMEVHG